VIRHEFLFLNRGEILDDRVRQVQRVVLTVHHSKELILITVLIKAPALSRRNGHEEEQVAEK
jgi:hypothetical protein